MRAIESRANETLKGFCALRDKRARDERGLFLVESRKMCFDALRLGLEPVAMLLRRGVSLSEEERALLGSVGGDEVYELAEPAFAKLAETPSSQGVAGCFRKRSAGDLSGGDLLILDRVQDPGNVGTLLRTAAACGTAVALCNCADPYAPKCVRASMGGVFAANFRECEDEEALALCSGRTVLVADMGGEDAFRKRLPPLTALVVGSEGQGVSAFWREHSEGAVALPMQPGIESLNAAVCGSVLLYQIKFARR